MIHAYDKVYLDKARIALGRMLDFAVYDLKYDICEFFELFITTGVAGQFGKGDFTLIAGMSGVELAYEVLERSNVEFKRIKPNYAANRSEEYWTGWALAYYQWETAIESNHPAKHARTSWGLVRILVNPCPQCKRLPDIRAIQ